MTLPTLTSIRMTHTALAAHCVHTPTVRTAGEQIVNVLGSEVFLKLELMQRTGTFKFRGAMNSMMNLARPDAGVTAVSAGNHAVAVACAAAVLGIDAKVVMLASANAARRELTRSFGAKIVFCESGPEAFAQADRLVEEEGRTFVHPFDGPLVANATAGVGLELSDDVTNLDAVVVAVGGGGLAGGFAAAVKQMQPQCRIYGVEPDGATVVQQSLAANTALQNISSNTIADSLAPPLTTPYVLDLCQRYIDEMVCVSDDALCIAMTTMFDNAKLAVEPAGAATLAAAMGPLRAELAGKRVALVVCGTCIDAASYAQLSERGRALVA